MNVNAAFSLLLLAISPLAVGQQSKPLFNGKDLTGWEGDPRLWKVENGILVGETNDGDKKVKANTFLVWKDGKLADFDLRVKARVTGGNNSGIQYRSAAIEGGEWALAGYQMDMHPKQEFLGMLYEEKGRGIVSQRGKVVDLLPGGVKKPVGDLPLEKVDLAQWNEFRIVARGNVLRHFVNGKKAVQVTDHDPEKRRMQGLLGLQLHAGPAMRLEVKSVELREFKPLPAAKPDGQQKEKPKTKPSAAAAPVGPAWIWSRESAGDGERVYFRKTFTLPAAKSAANLTMTCDNKFQVWVNGKPVGRGDDWSNPRIIEVRQHVNPGENVIAVDGENSGGIAALSALLEVELKGGEPFVLASDGSWKWSHEAQKGWEEAGFDDSQWKPVVVRGPMGMQPWGPLFGTGTKDEPQVARDMTDKFEVATGFKLEKLYDVPKKQGSWVSLALLPDGRFIASDQYGGLYRITPEPVGGPNAETKVEALDISIGGSQGMVWHRGALYVSVNEPVKCEKGVYRVTDSDNDGELDKVELLKKVEGGGEHGLHSLVVSPDGEWIYFICGNMTTVPDVDASWPQKNWDEDQLLPRNPDGRGHARSVMAPGGWVCRFKPDNSKWELVTNGFRNPYDMAFNAHGDLFAYDADMEWDLGMPWYRPTRLCHVVPGGEFGWRNGTGKWPAYQEDSLPAVVDIGPGSPVGVVSGLGAKFPAKFQRAIYLLDWTFATIYVIHLDREGSSYRGTKGEFVAGAGLPLTDAVIGKDGAMYFTTGGRRSASAFWRVTYVGTESTAPVGPAGSGSTLPGLIAKLSEASYPEVMRTLGSDDRHERFVARLEAERRPLASLKEALRSLTKGGNPWYAIGGSIALAHQGAESDRDAALAALKPLKWDQLSKAQRLGMLRAYGLVFIRLGAADENDRKQVLAQVNAAYPAADDETNTELCRMLSYLQEPTVVARTLKLMAADKDTEMPDWAKLATRNAGYGNDVLQMLREAPPAQDILYALFLRNVKGPWTLGQRRQMMEWFAKARARKGGKSYGLFLDKMQKDMLENATEAERTAIGEWKFAPPPSPFANLPQPEGPGRNWTVEEVAAIGSGDLAGADLENGKRMFQASLCAACHRVDGDGGAAGPDLTAVGGRFAPKDLAEALVDPGKTISDQYQFDIISKKDGSSVWGRVVDEKDDTLIVAVNAYDFSQTVEVLRSDVKDIEPSPVSPMPGALINRLNAKELKDLVAYLLKK